MAVGDVVKKQFIYYFASSEADLRQFGYISAPRLPAVQFNSNRFNNAVN